MHKSYGLAAFALVVVVLGLVFFSVADDAHQPGTANTSQTQPDRADPSAGSSSTR